MNIHEKVNMLRTRLMHSQEHFGKLVGASQSTISLIEHGHKKPSYDLLQRLNKLARRHRFRISFI